MARTSYNFIDLGADEARGYRQPRPCDIYSDSLARRRQLIEAQSYSYIDRSELCHDNPRLTPPLRLKHTYQGHWRVASCTDLHACSSRLGNPGELRAQQCHYHYALLYAQYLCPSSNTGIWTSSQMSSGAHSSQMLSLSSGCCTMGSWTACATSAWSHLHPKSHITVR